MEPVGGVKVVAMIDLIGLILAALAFFVNLTTRIDSDLDSQKSILKMAGIVFAILNFLTLIIVSLVFMKMFWSNYLKKDKKIYFFIRPFFVAYSIAFIVIGSFRIRVNRPWMFAGPILALLVQCYFTYFLYKFWQLADNKVKLFRQIEPGMDFMPSPQKPLKNKRESEI